MLFMFQEDPPHIIRCSKLYIEHSDFFKLDTCLYHGRVGTFFQLFHDSGMQQYKFEKPRRCMYSFELLMMSRGSA
jgi:hypothetical protein